MRKKVSMTCSLDRNGHRVLFQVSVGAWIMSVLMQVSPLACLLIRLSSPASSPASSAFAESVVII